MPMIDLYCPRDALTRENLGVAIEELTTALLRHEGAADNAQTRAMSRAFVHELPTRHVFLGGRPSTEPTYRVVLTVPAGTLLQGPGPVGTASRNAVVREVTEILLRAEGSEFTPAGAARVFCIVHEVPDGHWGGMGRAFRIDDIVAFSNPEAPQTDAAREARDAIAAVGPDGLTRA